MAQVSCPQHRQATPWVQRGEAATPEDVNIGGRHNLTGSRSAHHSEAGRGQVGLGPGVGVGVGPAYSPGAPLCASGRTEQTPGPAWNVGSSCWSTQVARTYAGRRQEGAHQDPLWSMGCPRTRAGYGRVRGGRGLACSRCSRNPPGTRERRGSPPSAARASIAVQRAQMCLRERERQETAVSTGPAGRAPLGAPHGPAHRWNGTPLRHGRRHRHCLPL